MFKQKLKALPNEPGVYIMYNKEGNVIYVGKAKNLKNRVSQYFQSSKSHPPKVAAMIENIDRFEYIITDTEFEALVLECNLIKKYTPKYNILLKDDKNFPYIKLTVNEEYPRILLARKIENDGALYFGPYLNSEIIKETIDISKKIFKIRTCKKVLPRDIGKTRPCLNYHINQCSAPCIGKISKEEYQSNFQEVISLLEGKHREITKALTTQMQQASQKLEFERAAKIRDKIIAIDKISEKQKIVSTNPGNQDIIAVAKEKKDFCIQIFFIRQGKMLGREKYFFKEDGEKGEILTDFIKQYYGTSTYIPKTIILQEKIEDIELIRRWLSEKCGASIKIVVPQRGEKLAMVKMAKNNAVEDLHNHLDKFDRAQRKINNLLLELKETLGLNEIPKRIESYDISNISGTNSVGVCVVFENGVAKKSDYKKFNIRSVEGANDYESMKEVLYRRLSNGVEGEKGFTPLPGLILIDGGKGHVNAVAPILDFFKLKIPLFGMVKDDRHRTKALTTADNLIDINRQSSLFLFLTSVQDEVHRFALASHKKRRKKSAIASQLDEITGVGPARKKALLKHFKTINSIKTASVQQLSSVQGIDKKTAQNIFQFFNDNG
ncbi:MAG: excinuclease ABC subunit UvrC [Firmicutes bacterium]|nr:excinuclease ABC subunit UvrC [Bacillota bacterium]